LKEILISINNINKNMSKIHELQEIIDSSDNIVFFGGAGVSTESGIPDFRSESGIFKSLEKYGDTPENLVSHSYYMDHTEEFFNYYRENLIFKDAEPNPAHLKLAELEKAGKLKVVITQNIDGLHQKAGSENVLELHGSIHRNYCQICGKEYGLDHILNCDGIPKCECGGTVKPDVVLYEEPLNNAVLSFSIDYIQNADTLIIGGTSLVVYPAAGLINYFRGKNLVLINKSETPYDDVASLVINEAIGETLSQIKV
jgi:NAD-dependent deacetylase